MYVYMCVCQRYKYFSSTSVYVCIKYFDLETKQLKPMLILENAAVQLSSPLGKFIPEQKRPKSKCLSILDKTFKT